MTRALRGYGAPKASWMATSAAIAARQSRWSRQIERASRLSCAAPPPRAPSRTAAGTVRPAARAIALAAAHTVPAAVRLGARAGGPEEDTRLARSIFRDHLLCLAAIAALVVIQLACGAP